MDQETEPEINISGLTYIPDFISIQDQNFLLSEIDPRPWLADIKRRVKHYGYKYDYKARAVGNDAYYEWQHAIPARKSDIINGIKTERTRRVSLTFRNVILD